MRIIYKLCRVVLLVPLLIGSIAAQPATATSQTSAEDDWRLPDWVKQSPNSGCYGCGDELFEVQLAWKDIEPREGQFN